ncbi:MAG: MFS transporter [Patescibacteria group bacterium]|nr:MFS transporter [Patescibacteria group bacterium]
MKRAKQLQANIQKMYFYQFLTGVHFTSAVLIPFYTDWAHISFAQAMILQSFFTICIFLLEVPTGAIADYFGRKTSIVLSCIFLILGPALYASFANFYLFFVAEFLFALGVALSSGAEEALIYDSLKELGEEKRSKKVFSKFNSLHMLGITFAAPIGSIIAKYMGLQFPMLLSTIPTFIALFFVISLKEPSINKQEESLRYIKVIKNGFNHILKNRILKILAIDFIIISIVSYFIIWLYQIALKNLGVDIKYFGFIHMILCLSQVAILGNFLNIQKIFKTKKQFLFFSAIITGISLIISGLSKSIILTIIAFALGIGFGNGRFANISNYMNKFIESKNRATVISSVSMFQRLAQAMVNPIVGYLTDWSLNYTFIILGSIAIIFSFISRVEEEHLID